MRSGVPGEERRHTIEVRPDAVRSELARILRSRAFGKSASLALMLEHLVEAKLQNRSDAVKEYTIGVDVFGRGASFDPRTDTIVRVQARRLRAKLAAYYADKGW